MNFDWINKLVMNHILAEPGAVALGVTVLHWADTIIFAALKFFPASTLDAYADKLDALIKSRIDADAKAPQGPVAHS